MQHRAAFFFNVSEHVVCVKMVIKKLSAAGVAIGSGSYFLFFLFFAVETL